MRIAITTRENNINSEMDQRFGRALGFMIYDETTGNTEFVDNSQVLNAASGAGVQAAKIISDNNADVLITGHVGPKAYNALNAADIKIFLKNGGTIQDCINEYKTGSLNEVSNPDVEGHWI